MWKVERKMLKVERFQQNMLDTSPTNIAKVERFATKTLNQKNF